MSELKSCDKMFYRHVLISVGERTDRKDIVNVIISKLLAMKEKISCVVDISVHQHQFQENDATALIADIAMIVVVSDIEAYSKHPYHIEVSEFIINHSASRVRVEYTI